MNEKRHEKASILIKQKLEKTVSRMKTSVKILEADENAFEAFKYFNQADVGNFTRTGTAFRLRF